MEKTVVRAVRNEGFQELGSKYIKFELPVRLLSRDVKWKVECLELRGKERLEI